MRRNAVETVMGAVVLVVAGFFLFFAYTQTRVQVASGYEVTARFDRVEGLRDGGDVRIAGIKVGSIVSMALDPKTYFAVVRMSIDPTVKLTTNATASILTVGLFGDKYLALDPGNEDKTIPPGGQIENTTPPVSLESIIGKFAFGQPQPQPNAPEAPK